MGKMIRGNKKFINAWNLLDEIPAAICIFKYEPGIPVMYYNSLLPMLLGYPEDQFSKIMTSGFMNILDHNGRRHFSGWINYYLDTPGDNDPIDIAYTVSGRNGEQKVFLQKCNFIFDSAGTKLFCCVINDITEQYKNERLLSLYTSIDALTRIFNRDALKSDIRNMIPAAKDGIQHALIVLDLDDFTKLNEKVGHDLCDVYLQRLGRLLVKPYKFGKTVGRVGDDEFAIFIVGGREDTIRGAAEEVCRELQKEITEYTVSMGICICHDSNTDFEALYKKAYQAMTTVKKNGKNGFAFYEDLR